MSACMKYFHDRHIVSSSEVLKSVLVDCVNTECPLHCQNPRTCQAVTTVERSCPCLSCSALFNANEWQLPKQIDFGGIFSSFFKCINHKLPIYGGRKGGGNSSPTPPLPKKQQQKKEK